MKSAEQWVEDLYQGHHCTPESWIELPAKELVCAVRNIQADALRWAVSLCSEDDRPLPLAIASMLANKLDPNGKTS